MTYSSILIVGLIAIVAGRLVERSAQLCPFDYFPCDCLDDGNSFRLSCENVLENRLEEIFRNTNVDRPFSFVYLIGNFTKLSANFIGNNLVEVMSIEWRGNAPALIDRDFMRFSENYTTGFGLNGLHGPVPLGFLENFTKLTILQLMGAMSFLESMPRLESLQKLYLLSESLSQLYDPALTPSLTDIVLVCNVSDDKKLDFLLGFNATLTWLYATKFEDFPTKISAMSRLTTLALNGSGTLLRRDSLTAMANLSTVDIDFPLETIEEGAFQGDFSNTNIYLTTNGLRRFEEGVFRPLLESMVDKGTGLVYLRNSFVECDCHLAWIIRDNHHLLPRVWNGFCSDGSTFESLSPESFVNCPEGSSTVHTSSTPPSTFVSTSSSSSNDPSSTVLSSTLGSTNGPSSSTIPGTSSSAMFSTSSFQSTPLSTSLTSINVPSSSTVQSSSSSPIVSSNSPLPTSSIPASSPSSSTDTTRSSSTMIDTSSPIPSTSSSAITPTSSPVPSTSSSSANNPTSSLIPSTSSSTIKTTSSPIPSTSSISTISTTSPVPSISSGSTIVTSSPVPSTSFSSTNYPTSSLIPSTSSRSTNIPTSSPVPSTSSSNIISSKSPLPTTPSSSTKLVSDLLLITASMFGLLW